MRRTIAGIGRALVALGLLTLLFVGYQLWGTGVFTARAQTRLKHEFRREQQARVDDPLVRSPTSVSSPIRRTTTTTALSPAREGDVEGMIDIPKIGLHMAFVEGVSLDDLKKGPGHYPTTPLPGQFGNAAIAGHRTTYLHPFYHLDDLDIGDDIHVTTLAGTYTYRLRSKWIAVAPTEVSVLDPPLDPHEAELTLTACHPRYSARQRIVVHAFLVRAVSASPTVTVARPVTRPASRTLTATDALEEGLSGATRSLTPTVVWGIVTALVGLVWWWTFRRWRHPLTWIVGALPFLAVLLPFYVYLERALPPGF